MPLKDSSFTSLGIGIIEFIISSPSEATQQVPLLIDQAKQEISDPISQEKVIELIEKIVVYKFPLIPRQEIEAMFNLVDWKQTRFYQDTLLEGKLEGKLETIPAFLRLGLTPEQIARELNLDLTLINQYITNQNN